MHHEMFVDLPPLGIDQILQDLQTTELATYAAYDDQRVLTRVLVATELGVVDLVLRDDGSATVSQLPWTMAYLVQHAWTGTPPDLQYFVTLSFIDDPLPAPKPGFDRHAFDDFMRFVIERGNP